MLHAVLPPFEYRVPYIDNERVSHTGGYAFPWILKVLLQIDREYRLFTLI